MRCSRASAGALAYATEFRRRQRSFVPSFPFTHSRKIKEATSKGGGSWRLPTPPRRPRTRPHPASLCQAAQHDEAPEFLDLGGRQHSWLPPDVQRKATPGDDPNAGHAPEEEGQVSPVRTDDRNDPRRNPQTPAGQGGPQSAARPPLRSPTPWSTVGARSLRAGPPPTSASDTTSRPHSRRSRAAARGHPRDTDGLARSRGHHHGAPHRAPPHGASGFAHRRPGTRTGRPLRGLDQGEWPPRWGLPAPA